MNYLILIVVLTVLILTIKNLKVIVKAAKRVNLLYDYFIIKGNASKEDIQRMSNFIDDKPDPNDGSGCPNEEQLKGEG